MLDRRTIFWTILFVEPSRILFAFLLAADLDDLLTTSTHEGQSESVLECDKELFDRQVRKCCREFLAIWSEYPHERTKEPEQNFVSAVWVVEDDILHVSAAL